MNWKSFTVVSFIFSLMITGCFSNVANNYNCSNNSDCFKGEECINSKCEAKKLRDTGTADTLEPDTNSSPELIKQCPGNMTSIPQKDGWDHRFLALSTEVTQCLWGRVMDKNPSNWEGKDLPVQRAGLDDAVKFTNNLSKAYGFESCYELKGCSYTQECDKKECVGSGIQCSQIRFKEGIDCSGFRLPTEAEWEHMARSGSKKERYGELGRIACYLPNSRGEPCRTASKDPNHWGLYDTLGNVWELTWGNFETSVKPPGQEPKNPAGWSWITIRGGSFADKKEALRFGNRGPLSIKISRFTVGFRIVRTIRP